MSRIRIIDVARIAGVSTGTVDRVIHDREGVSEQTRIRVQKIIEEYDYQPDILAGVLASNRSYRFLVCMPESVNAHEFWKFPLEGVESALGEIRHYNIRVEYLLFDQHRQSDFEAKVSGVKIDEFDGLLLAPVFNNASLQFLQLWRANGKPVVMFNSRVEGFTADSFIGQDAFQSGYLGGRIMSYGLERDKDILIVNLTQRKDHYIHINKRERGFRSYFEDHGERVRNLVSLDINGGSYQRVEKVLQEAMKTYDVAGIFATNSRVHLVAEFLANRGAMHIRLIGYDLLPVSIDFLNREYIDFLISQSPEEQAYKGLKYLFNFVVLKQEIAENVLLPIDILTKENVQYYIK